MDSEALASDERWDEWNVRLWIKGDEDTYRLVCDKIKEHDDIDVAALEVMECLSIKYGLRQTPDGANITFRSVRKALREIV